MPRKRRNPKARLGTAVEISNALLVYLAFGNYRLAMEIADDETAADLYFFGDDGRRFWLACADRAVELHARFYPGRRPASWWKYSAPEPRQVNGDSCESEASYLRRLGLFLPGESARVKKTAFEAEPRERLIYTTAPAPSIEEVRDALAQ